MDQTPRVSRGLRYLCLDQYTDSTPELVTANIIKLRLLQSFDLENVLLPAQPGFPHDGAVRISQEMLEPERLIWFDFLVLLEDRPGTASRYGTTTMAQAGNASRPAFYIVIFPDSPKYVAIVPHSVAWREGESDCYDITGTGITGPYFPYLMADDLIPLALERISLIPWGCIYANPGTGVFLNRWLPVLTESPRDSPTATLGWSSALVSSNSATRKRRRGSDAEVDIARPAPALREAVSPNPLDFELDTSWTEQDPFDPNWPFSDHSGLSVLPGLIDDALQATSLVEAQLEAEYIHPAPCQGVHASSLGQGRAQCGCYMAWNK